MDRVYDFTFATTMFHKHTKNLKKTCEQKSKKEKYGREITWEISKS